jgi:hypothetical protein
MPIGEILEKSFKYPWKNKSLIFYGVLLALFSFGSNLTSSYSPTESEMQDISNYFYSLNEKTIASFLVIGLVVIVIGILLGIVGVIVAAWSQVALAKGTALLEAGKGISRKEIGKTGKRVIWKMLVLDLFLPLGIVLAFTLIVGTFIALCALMPQPAGMWVGIALGTLALISLITFAVYATQVWIFARRFVALENMKAMEALKAGRDLLKGKFWWTVLLGIIMGMISGSAGIFAFIPLIIIGGVSVYLVTIEMFVGAIITGIISLIYLLLFLVFTGYFVAFQQVGLTIWWLKLKQTNKVTTKPVKKKK